MSPFDTEAYHFAHAQHTLVPDEFLPAIGLVMVQHAFLDRELMTAICLLAEMDRTTGVSILVKLQMTGARTEVFRNLAKTKVQDESLRRKLEVLADVINELCADRNTIAHSTPHAWSPSKEELVYFKEANMTMPQLKVQPPYVATIASLHELAKQIFRAGVWLGMLRPMWVDDTKDPKAKPSRHPDWSIDAEFPWPDRLQRKK